jgi:hypothetical protein
MAGVYADPQAKISLRTPYGNIKEIYSKSRGREKEGITRDVVPKSRNSALIWQTSDFQTILTGESR